jgi:membrane protease YdiL (CAAX protease family)
LLESTDRRAQLILWITIGVCAPIAEELLFRGFLFPALSQNLGIGWSIGVSGFAFALVHLNLADLLPLTVLGWGLGYIYYRCQNLLAPMLCHSLWNTGSFLALLALGQ